MSFSRVYSAQISLLKAHIIHVETDLSGGLYAFSIVGLPDKAVEESKDRLSAAIKNSGFKSPKQSNKKTIISLAPAHLKKEGPAFDLSAALGYLLASEDIKFDPEGRLFLGELSLDGTVREIPGVLPITREAKKKGFKEIYVPKGNAKEASTIHGIRVFGVKNLKEIIDHLNEKKDNTLIIKNGDRDVKRKIKPTKKTMLEAKEMEFEIDFGDIESQDDAKRGLLIAASGGHNVAMWGPPGTGKTMLAKAFAGILPPLSFEEMLDVTSIHSVAGTLFGNLVTHPPFRSPHHTASYVSLVGGGTTPKPGEATLAHKGVLYMDEFPEFDRRVIEALRQPLEDRVVSISRAKGSAIFPASFILIATMNPCPCGNFGVKGRECVCSASNLQRYKTKLSGPIVDRIDIWLEVGSVDHRRLLRGEDKKKESESKSAREKVLKSRKIQEERAENLGISGKTNAELKVRDLNKALFLLPEAKRALDASASSLGLSARSYHRVAKLARTIADLSESKNIETDHIMEALQYRPKQISS